MSVSQTDEVIEAYLEENGEGDEMFVLHSELSPFGWMAVDETVEVKR